MSDEVAELRAEVEKWKQASREDRGLWLKVASEQAAFRAECEKVGLPYDAAGLVRHHRGNAGLAAANLQLVAETHRDQVAQALWDVWVAYGHDADGDRGPGAHIAGMGIKEWARSVVADMLAVQRDNEAEARERTSQVVSLEAGMRRVRAVVEMLANEEITPTGRRLLLGVLDAERVEGSDDAR